jgi:cyclopropane-fatty-acyl-phospholipid synthase
MNTPVHSGAGGTEVTDAADLGGLAIASGQVSAIDRWLGRSIQARVTPASVRIRLWDGQPLPGAPERPVADLLLRDRATLLRLIYRSDFWFGEAYMAGRALVIGNLTSTIEALSTRASSIEPSVLEQVLAKLAPANTLSKARHNVHEHYDLGNDFYRLWLDPEMLYTCAYYPSETASLEEAQEAKMDLVCRKLHLQPGDSVVEAGCGWGALALFMARRYGVTVKAFNVSKEQLAWARERARREGLADRVEFVDDDYRNIKGEHDVFVSVGMLEHVGLAEYPTLGRLMRRAVKREGGRGLLHFIGRDVPRPLNAWIRHRIFPGAYPPTLDEVTTRILKPAGMSVIDVDNLRLHYARTCEHWGERFARARDQVRAMFDEPFARAWELYLAGSRAAFIAGSLQLFQVVFTPVASRPPYWTRETVYDPAGAGPHGATLRA